MALEKQTRVDSIEVLPDGTMKVRWATVILEDGVQFGEPVYRTERHKPGADISGTGSSRVMAVAEAVWTPEVVEAAEAKDADGDGVKGR